MSEAAHVLVAAAGAGAAPSTGWAPGRCTIVGDHVDYAGGVVLCVAIDLGVSVAVRASRGATSVVAGAGFVVERADLAPEGDRADRVLATVLALRQRGFDVPAVEVGIAATLPAGAGLASSAALIVATATALLRMGGWALSARDLAAVALAAERDIVGVPCGILDQRAVIDAHAGAALLLDCRSERATVQPWPSNDVALCVCDSRTHHDVGGTAYRRRRAETEAGLRDLRVSSCQEVGEASLAASGLDPVVMRRVRHAIEETGRSLAAAGALRRGDIVGLGTLMNASHASLRDQAEVSTPLLDAIVAAAQGVGGCFGARLVGAGFGGAVVALVRRDAISACSSAMADACGGGPVHVVSPSSGVALLAADVVRG